MKKNYLYHPFKLVMKPNIKLVLGAVCVTFALWYSGTFTHPSEFRRYLEPLSDLHFHGAHGQDRWLLDLFLSLRQKHSSLEAGIFIEAGMFDGTTGSNMYVFEKHFNWSGICFEPNKDLYKKAKRARQCFALNAGVCQSTGTFEYTQLAAPRDQESGVFEFMTERRKNDVLQQIATGQLQVDATYPINCVTVEDALELAYHGSVARVDVFSLDVESSELHVLRSIDFSRTVIDIFLIEASHQDEVLQFMRDTDLYHHVSQVGDDLVFFRKDSAYVDVWLNGCRNLRKPNEGYFKFVAPDMHWRCESEN